MFPYHRSIHTSKSSREMSRNVSILQKHTIIEIFQRNVAKCFHTRIIHTSPLIPSNAFTHRVYCNPWLLYRNVSASVLFKHPSVRKEFEFLRTFRNGQNMSTKNYKALDKSMTDFAVTYRRYPVNCFPCTSFSSTGSLLQVEGSLHSVFKKKKWRVLR